MGLLYMGSFLRSFGFDIALIDCLDKHAPESGHSVKIKKYGIGNYRREVVEKPAVLQHIPRRYARYGISEQYFINQLKNHADADAVLITSIMTYWYPGVVYAVNLVRQYLPGVPVILGGIYATLLPQHAREVVKPDYIVSGPGEIKTLRLLGELLDVELNEEPLPKTLDDYPYPAFDLINHPDYLILMTTRGCPYDCSFCAQKKIAMPYTRRQPRRVVQEVVEQYRRFQLRDFAFYDDALFIAKEKHIQAILEEIIKRRLPVRFHSPNGLFARYIDLPMAKLMHRSGFKTIRISFETSNERRRKDMYSKVSNEDMIKAVEHLTKAGYRSKELEAYVLMGLPGQELEEVIASILFVHHLGVQVRLASFSPIPGTREFDKAVSAGKIAADIDPLLTNKSIFPLSDETFTYETFRKVRVFTQTLNDAVQRDLRMFSDPLLGRQVRNVIQQMP